MYNLEQIRDIHLEVTSRCQARCPMCPRRMQGGPMMPFVTLDDINLETFKEWFPVSFIQQLDKVNMCGNLGDPIINTETLDIYKYLREVNPNIILQMHTNGSARNSAWWQELASVGVTVVFGIDGLADTHSRYRINTDFHTILVNARTFIKAGGNARWDMLVFRHNKHQVEECRQLASELGFSDFKYKNSSRFKNGQFNVLDDNGKTIDILYPTETSESFIKIVEEAKQEINPTITCKAQESNSIYVGANGNIAPCCWLDLEWLPPVNENRIDYMDKIGNFPNLNKHTLQEIFDSNFFSSIESTWSNGCLKECQKQCGKFDKLGAQFES